MRHDGTDDAALLAAMAAGDVRAARALSNRLTPIVFSHAMRLVGNAALSEDITQEALIRLWKIAPAWEADRAKVTTWLYRVTANICMDHLRKKKILGSDDVPELVDDTASAAEQMQNKSRADAMQTALMQLPDRQRQAVVLRHIDGFPNPEIATIMDLSVEAVESLTSRGKRALTQLLMPQKSALSYEDEEV
ncbi:MAG: sigma-70 family RNA polymerase sigma factor [Planktomarina sp.]